MFRHKVLQQELSDQRPQLDDLDLVTSQLHDRCPQSDVKQAAADLHTRYEKFGSSLQVYLRVKSWSPF